MSGLNEGVVGKEVGEEGRPVDLVQPQLVDAQPAHACSAAGCRMQVNRQTRLQDITSGYGAHAAGKASSKKKSETKKTGIGRERSCSLQGLLRTRITSSTLA